MDVAGAHVKRLLSGAQVPAGRHVVDWRGRHDDGRPAAAGVYFIRLQAAGIERTEAVTLLK